MKLGDMTFKQIAKICAFHKCSECPFCKDCGSCILLDHIPAAHDLNLVVNTDEKG